MFRWCWRQGVRRPTSASYASSSFLIGRHSLSTSSSSFANSSRCRWASPNELLSPLKVPRWSGTGCSQLALEEGPAGTGRLVGGGRRGGGETDEGGARQRSGGVRRRRRWQKMLTGGGDVVTGAGRLGSGTQWDPSRPRQRGNGRLRTARESSGTRQEQVVAHDEEGRRATGRPQLRHHICFWQLLYWLCKGS